MPLKNFLNQCWPCDYVVGRNLLLTYISIENATKAGPSTTESRFEAEVTQTFETFRYEKVLQSLNNEPSQSSDNVQDPRKGLLGTFGFLHRTMSEESFKEDITMRWIIPEIRVLQTHASDAQSESSSTSCDETSPPPYSSNIGIQTELVQSEQPSMETQSPRNFDAEISRYTSRLWEYSQIHNDVPRVSDTMLSSFPTRFRVVVEFRGTKGQGEASSKKQAKHIASRDVCRQLGLVL